MQIFQMMLIAVVVLFTLAAVFSDLQTRRIPNWLTVPTFALALVFHVSTAGVHGLVFSLLGFATGFTVVLVLWLLGSGGGGDVKMLGALGAWLGVDLIVQVFLASAAVTLLLAVVPMLYEFFFQGFSAMRRRHLAGGSAQGEVPGTNKKSARKRRRGRLVPYAVPVALSTWAVLVLAWKTGALP